MSLHHGDCLDVMAAMEPESVDAIVTDPPYGLAFMGKDWDNPSRLASLATHDRHMSKSGRPDPWPRTGVGPTAVRFDGTRYQEWTLRWAEAAFRVAKPSAYLLAFGGTRTVHRLTCAIEDAGWIIRDMLVWAYASGFPKSKASLKPAWEPIVMARKPGPLRMLAIDACRIEAGAPKGEGGRLRGATGSRSTFNGGNHSPVDDSVGRWPSNVILTDPIFDGGWDGVVGGGGTASGSRTGEHSGSGSWSGQYGPVSRDIDGDSGIYSRFFLVPKADRADREPIVMPAGHDPSKRFSNHPTVKPTELMRHLVRLVTPSGGTVLDPFAGSGSTLLAAEQEGFEWVGIEKEAEYVAIAEARLNGTQRGLGLGA